MAQEKKINYKDTLILPETNFPMKANLFLNEKERYKKWSENNVYDIMSVGQKHDFILHDGPPYANGHLHIGHALNKILKDFIVKFHFFNGKNVNYIPGWDCHGLPIEQQVENTFKEKNIETNIIDIRKSCREHAAKFLEIQKNEFLDMGVIGNFNNPYKTMDYKFESQIYKNLVKIAKNGLLFERSKPVFWSWAAKSALADAEIEYKMKKSDSIFVAFPLDSESNNKIENLIKKNTFKSNLKIIIWTTTPWTLPSNVAIALNPNEKYAITSEGEIVANELYASLKEKNIIKGELISTLQSNNFEYLKAINPLNDRESVLVLGDHVTLNEGSGAVHTAPGHGEDDYFLALKYELPIIMAIDDDGLFDESIFKLNLFKKEVINDFLGMHIFKAQKKILELLKDHILKHEEITHSYPHCWRTKKPVIFRATKQWFILMDKPYFNESTLREVALSEIEKTKFYPNNGINRLRNMVENRPDWCISRQRDWGVPIAFLMDKESKTPLLDEEVTDLIAHIFEKEGCDSWWEKDIEYFLPENLKSNSKNYYKNMHILDVWFDSGSTWSSVLYPDNYPADLYLEGSDQHRGWFQSSLLLSCAINFKSPFKAILTHGFVDDESGEKMSKSKGNVITPIQIAKDYGNEVLRLWIAMGDYQHDLKVSKDILKQVSDIYLKLRNTFRFLLANTNDLKCIDINTLSLIDKWILNSAFKNFNDAHLFFNNYDFNKGFQVLNGFVTNELSGIYFDICKDSLYCDSKSNLHRIGIQSTMAMILNHLLHLLSPFLTYTVDEALEYANSEIKNNAKNVFDFKKINYKFDFESINFDTFIRIRNVFNEALDFLKKEKIVKSSLELELILESNAQGLDLKILKYFLMLSDVLVSNCENSIYSFEIENFKFKIIKSKKFKCPRCWQFNSEEEDVLCIRCNEVMDEVFTN